MWRERSWATGPPRLEALGEESEICAYGGSREFSRQTGIEGLLGS